MDGNTILITGGSSGIGRGLAEAFQKRGNKVIIGGRTEARLKEVAAANPGMEYLVVDCARKESIEAAAAEAERRWPGLNVVFNNAGVQKTFDFAGGAVDERALEEEIDTNVYGVVRVAAAFLPLLKRQREAWVVNTSSGLAFVPMAVFPVYCATKAFVHSFSMSLRVQLKETSVRVVELAPPYVATELDRDHKDRASAHQAMPLAEYVAAAMKELESGADEAAVGFAKMGRDAVMNDKVMGIFARLNG